MKTTLYVVRTGPAGSVLYPEFNSGALLAWRDRRTAPRLLKPDAILAARAMRAIAPAARIEVVPRSGGIPIIWERAQ